MYSTKAFAPKNSKDYISIKDDYNKPKQKKDSCIGKQFQTEPPKKGQTAGYFSALTYSPSPFQTGTQYRDVPKKSGFGSHECRRRDEFTLDIRARQWREKLKTEMEFAKRNIETSSRRCESAPSGEHANESPLKRRQRKYKEKYADQPELFQTKVPWTLYDIGKTAVTPICNKCSRETFYCRHRVASQKMKRPGTAPTSYEVYGNFEKYPVEKPVYGNVNELKNFCDRSHLAPGGAKYTY